MIIQLAPHGGSGNRNSQNQVVRLCRVPLEFLNHPGMLADGTYLVPDTIKNFQDDPRDVRQALEPAYCVGFNNWCPTGVPLASHFRQKTFAWLAMQESGGVPKVVGGCWRMVHTKFRGRLFFFKMSIDVSARRLNSTSKLGGTPVGHQ